MKQQSKYLWTGACALVGAFFFWNAADMGQRPDAPSAEAAGGLLPGKSTAAASPGPPGRAVPTTQTPAPTPAPQLTATPAAEPARSQLTAPAQPTGQALERALREESTRTLADPRFARHQVFVKALHCETEHCAVALQLPPFVEAAQRRDNRVVAEVLQAMQLAYGSQGAEVGISKVDHGPEGMGIELSVALGGKATNVAADRAVAKIRGETLLEYIKTQGPKNP